MTENNTFEPGPVLAEPCGYFFRLGMRRGRAQVSGEMLDKVRGEIAGRMNRDTIGAAEATLREKMRWLTDECEALATRLCNAEDQIGHAAEELRYVRGLLERVLTGDAGEVAGAALYVERVRIARQLMWEEFEQKGMKGAEAVPA